MTRAAQLLLVLAALALWVASRMTWVVLESADGLGPQRTTTVSGATWAAALVPVAALLVAAALAPLAVRGWALRVVALLIAVVSAGVGYMSLSLWMVPDFARYAAAAADVPIVHLVGGSERQYIGAALTLVAAACTLVGAVVLLRAAATSKSATGKYVAPAARRAAARRDEKGDAMSERMIWDALDEGRDPTSPDNEGR